jgi:hypothetical protein
MHDQPNPSPGERMDRADQNLLATLTCEDSHRPWAVAELAAAMAADPGEALARLSSDGLIHRCGQFVWATRAAVRASELHNL